MRIADRIVLMRHGRIVQIGTAETLYRQPSSLFAARFFCDFTEIEGQVLTENKPMLAFVRSLGFTVRSSPEDAEVMMARKVL